MGRWLWRGYIHTGGYLIGRWRDSFTPEHLRGYEGAFAMVRAGDIFYPPHFPSRMEDSLGVAQNEVTNTTRHEELHRSEPDPLPPSTAGSSRGESRGSATTTEGSNTYWVERSNRGSLTSEGSLEVREHLESVNIGAEDQSPSASTSTITNRRQDHSSS